MIDDVKSFISSLLAKQQEEFVKIVNNLYVAKPSSKAEEEPYEVKKMIMEECKQAILADIKSKLNKEEPAYIGGVNLTTNDTEISNRLAVTDKNIDQLRQWLNEDRIDDFKKMITNDDIKFWLDIK
jgi:DeoR/GlpR family transcriptional regulator of sugar metabolism